MKQFSYKVPGGKMIKIKVQTEGERIEDILILGDFFLHPESTLLQIEMNLKGCAVDAQEIEKTISQVISKENAQIIGASEADMAKAVISAIRS
jgi:lipoate-protein ligase A